MIIFQRRLTLAPSTLNREARTVEAVLSAGAEVQRRDGNGNYTERLDPAGMTVGERIPLLDSHNRGSIAGVLGFVANIRTENGEVRGTLTITDDRALELVASGAVNGISIGYRVSQWRTEGKTRTAAKWDLVEASLTSVPADPGAILRDDPAVTDRAAVNSRIRGLANLNLGISQATINGLIDRGASFEEASAAAMAELQTRSVHIPAHQIGLSGDDPSVIVDRMSAALAHRIGARAEVPEAARQYLGLGLHDMLRTVLAARGERIVNMPAVELLTRAGFEGTGDLPMLLSSSVRVTLLESFRLATSPVFGLSVQRELTDFRPENRARLGEMAWLDKIDEHAEITNGGVVESGEQVQLATYAKGFAVSRNALVNDSTGSLGTIAAGMGRAAAETQNQALVSLLTTGSGLGPVMSDGNRLFHSAHGNVSGSGGAPDGTTLAAAVQAMRVQKGLDGKTPINAVPRFLLVSPAKEAAARAAVASFYPATIADVQPFNFEVLVEARLGGNRWYTFADPAALHVLEHYHLASAPGPQIESRPSWNRLGMEWRVVLDFTSAAVEWRGAYTNAGA